MRSLSPELLLRECRKAALGTLARPGRIEAVRLIGDTPGRNVLALDAVALEVAHRAARPVDLELVKIRPAEANELGVGVGEQAALQQRIVGEVDARHDVSGVEGDLLGLGEEVVDVAVEHHLADDLEWDVLFRDQLGGIQHVELELVSGFLVEGLDTELPLGKIAAFDRVEQVAAMEIRIGAADLDRLIPQHRCGAGGRPPVEFHECRFALGVDETERVDSEPLDHAVRARNGAIRHHPHQHVHALGHERREIPERVVRRGGLREAAVRLHLHGVDQVGKLDGILDEEHRNIVADEVEVAFLGIELDGEAAHVARQVDRAGAAGDGGEPHEDLGLLLRVLQEGRLGELGERFRRLEIAMRPGAARMHDTLGDALMVEMRDLLAQDEIFEQARAALAALERILIVGDRRSLVGREPLVRTAGILVRLPAVARFRARGGAFRRFVGHVVKLRL